MSALGDAVEFRLRQGEEAQRTLDMLRVTVNERIAHYVDEAMREQGQTTRRVSLYAKAGAFEDVLSLLGPEPAWYTDPDTESPF